MASFLPVGGFGEVPGCHLYCLCAGSPGRKKWGEEEGSTSWVCGSAFSFLRHGLVVGDAGLSRCPTHPPPCSFIISVFCCKPRGAAVQNRCGVE